MKADQSIARAIALISLAGFVVSLALATTASAAGKSRKKASAQVAAPAAKGKRVLALAPVEKVRIELPDHQLRDFGEDFLAKLRTRFTQSRDFVVVDAEFPENSFKSARKFQVQPSLGNGYEWESHPAPAATVRVTVNALTFVTGARGGRMFYGFDERFRNSFNDGTGERLNEFPVSTKDTGEYAPSWFDGNFAPHGSKPLDSLSGLDLGDGFSLDILFAWLRVKYAKYHAELRLNVEIDAPLAGRRENRPVAVTGSGFFYDVAGAYAQYDGALRLARRDAMLKAFNRAFEQASARIQASVAPLPLTARVDAVTRDGQIFLGTGRSAEIPVGTRYLAIDDPSVQIQVIESFQAGSLASVTGGEPSRIFSIYPGMLFRELSAEFPAPAPALGNGARKMALNADSNEVGTRNLEGIIIDLPTENLPPAQFGGTVRDISRTRAFFLSLLETVFLPYRIWRYYQYDRSYKSEADDTSWSDSIGKAITSRSLHEWADSARHERWSAQIGLNRVPAQMGTAPPETAPVIAILDSGMDYNHAVLHDSLWLNPNPTKDAAGRMDRYGWDFISGDSRPHDDGYHGTRIASALLAIAPEAKIMPLKVFNPWGVTSSAALYAAFEYALDHGAQIILCPWSTRFPSEAVERGVALAAERGVPVVAAAGDLGRDLRIAPAYPAALAPKYRNLIIVTAVDANDRPLRLSNAHPTQVHLAAPGGDIRVAEPRNMETRANSTGLAAAIVAGSIARKIAELSSPEESRQTDWRAELQASCDRIAGLRAYAENGCRLRVDR